jgi:hypothetical protein
MTMITRRGMTPAASIDDWLNLVDPDGAFLTSSQLRGVFPHGFDPMPAEQRSELRARVTDLDADAASQPELRRWLLGTVLEWSDDLAEGQQLPATSLVRAAEHGVQLRPTHALLDVDDANKIRLAVFTWPNGTRLDRRPDVSVAGDAWPASPVQRAETWCRESGVPLALVTDDDQWVLVWAPRGAAAASCRWRIGDLADERILQAGLLTLLGARRFFAVGADETLEELFRSAADAEVEITKGLGLSVRRSVELLVAAISRDDVASDGTVLAGVASTEVYEAAVTVLMRLVFLLFAEERRLLPAEDPLWAESYSVLTLRDDLRTAAVRDGDDALERRSTAWHRLLATFRAVHGGVNHDRLTLPAYGGSLFDPDRFRFLEGRGVSDHLVAGGVDLGPTADGVEHGGRPVAIDDRTVLAILDALLTIEVKAGRSKVAQRVSYKALDVEQIGHCYEGLLDHGAVRIDVLSLALVGPEGGEPEISIIDLETQFARGSDALCEWLSDRGRCSRAATALASLLAKQPEGVDLARLRVACGHDDDAVARVLPFWGLIRTDLRGLPIVLLPDSQYVTQTSTRRTTGAQYTTKALAEEIARFTLEPLVYEPGPQNEVDPERWKLRTPASILDLRVCDPAVGSGAILTAAGRFLADRLIESVVQHGAGEGPFAERLTDLAMAPAEEQVVLARREIVDHCLYGVDKNPVAAEMAKLSLWLTTMARERPFTFLDHAIQVGDSLLGITDLEQLRWLHLEPSERRGAGGFETLALDARIAEATDLAERLQELSVITVRDAAEKQRLHNELRATLIDLAIVADAVVGAGLSAAGRRGFSIEQQLGAQVLRVRAALDPTSSELERSAALAALHGISAAWLRSDIADDSTPWDRQCLHWPLAFPEVFLRKSSGFDAIVGNPPFLNGTAISTAFGSAFFSYICAHVAGERTGRADLVTFFFRRAALLARRLGLLATNSISQGDSREVGLNRLVDAGWVIYRAVKSTPWPNAAALEVAKVWMSADGWTGPRLLEGEVVETIATLLMPEGRAVGEPHRLAGLASCCYEGCYPLGPGFNIEPEHARALLKRSPMERDVLAPYWNGDDLNSSPTQRASKWAVNFGERTESESRHYRESWQVVESQVRQSRLDLGPSTYPGLKQRWWQYWRPRNELYRAISSHRRALVIAQTSKAVLPIFVDMPAWFDKALRVFTYDDDGHLGVLSSAFHWWWVIAYSSTLETRIRYSPSDVFETFAQPAPQSGPTWERISDAGGAMSEFRRDLMSRTNLGLTKTYNRVHDPALADPEITRLRELHVDLDHAVRDAYGWRDLELDHHHWETPQGMRFTISLHAKNEMLDRLLELNHARYAEEVAAGLHDGKKPKARAGRQADRSQGSLL